MTDAAPAIVMANDGSDNFGVQPSRASQKDHRQSIQQLQSRVQDLLARVALQEADNTSLQQTKAVTKDQLRVTHAKLTTTTTALTALTVSYAERLDEKNGLVSDNADLEQTNATLRHTIAAQLATIRDSEAQIQDLQKENRGLMSRLGVLGNEIASLKQRLEQLELEEHRQTMRASDDSSLYRRGGRGTYAGPGQVYRGDRGGLSSVREEERGSTRRPSKADVYKTYRPARSAPPTEVRDDKDDE